MINPETNIPTRVTVGVQKELPAHPSASVVSERITNIRRKEEQMPLVTAPSNAHSKHGLSWQAEWGRRIPEKNEFMH